MTGAAHLRAAGARRSLLAFVTCAVLAMTAAPGHLNAQDSETVREYKVKAAFVYNFVRFTKWPDAEEAIEAGKPVVIGILGEDPFGKDAFESVENRVIPSKSRKLLIRRLGRFKSGMDLRGVDLLYVSASEKEYFKSIAGMLAGKRVLTVADESGFIESGGMIGLVIRDRNIRWELNDDAVKKSGLKINAQIYGSAVRVIRK